MTTEIKFAIYKHGEDGGFYDGNYYDENKRCRINLFVDRSYSLFDSEEEAIKEFEEMKQYESDSPYVMYELKRMFY